MDAKAIERASPLIGTGKDLPHLSGPAAAVRQVLAAYFVRDCPHILEIGGHIRPITPYLTHRPVSVTVVDPKATPYEAEELNGAPCRVRHVARKFQDWTYRYEPRTYAVVMLGLSLKPLSDREPLGELLYGLLDNALTVVIEYPPALDRAARQFPQLLDRKVLTTLCSLELRLHDDMIENSPYALRRFVVLKPKTSAC